MRLQVGDDAPDFSLPGTGGREHTLHEHLGHPVVLAFYPADNTPVCTVQLASYTEDLPSFEELGARVLGISPQDLGSHEAFAAKHGFRFPLLADVDKRVGEAYGILGPLGFYRRSVFVIDRRGRIAFAHRSLTSASFRPTDELVTAIRDLA